MQKRNHQRKKLRGKLRKCKIARRHNCHLIVVLCNPFGFIIERAKYINFWGIINPGISGKSSTLCLEVKLAGSEYPIYSNEKTEGK